MPSRNASGAGPSAAGGVQAPYSEGTRPPVTRLPAGATDCHHHVFDPRYPERQGLHPLPDAYREVPPDIAAYSRFQKRLGLGRSILVAPSNYGDDNSLLLDALATVGQDKARGVAIVAFDAADAELDRLHSGGVRGIRVYLARDRAPSPGALLEMAERLAGRGWHLQLVGTRDHEVFVDWESVLAKAPCRVVIDHFGYAPLPAGSGSATAGVLRRLLDGGRAYVKLSGVYIQSRVGYPTYSDMDELAIDLIRHAPERVVWGSDWPHVGAPLQKPDGAQLIEQMEHWAPAEPVRDLILVQNPDRLYWAV